MTYQVIKGSAHSIPQLADKSVHVICCSPPYMGLRSYDGDQAIEWPTVEYSPMPGLPPIRIQGCEPGCRHEWVDGKTIRQSGGGVESSTLGPKSGGHGMSLESHVKSLERSHFTTTQGAYCIHCGGWRGPLGLEPDINAYIGHLILVLREMHRILRDDGTAWINLGDSYSSLTIVSEYYKIRDDITFKEKCHVAMEMFGVRIDGYEAASAGDVRQVLSGISPEGAKSGRPRLENSGQSQELPETQKGQVGQAEGEASPSKMDGNRNVGREVRMLRGDNAGIPDGGSHQRGRGSTSQVCHREKSSEFTANIPGYSESGVSTGQISSSVLQLQLLDRVLGILSTHSFQEHEIPLSARDSFTRRIAPLKKKDLMGVPWRFAFAAQADGWILRNDIIWAKPNPMPESVTDRCTKAHEYIFMLAKQEAYYFDAEAIKEEAINAGKMVRTNGNDGMDQGYDGHRTRDGLRRGVVVGSMRNKRSVWTVATSPFAGAHFACWPEKLVEPMIKAGSSQYGCCPKCGAPWERVVERTPYPRDATAHRGDSNWAVGATVRNDTDLTRSGQEFNEWKAQNPDVTTGWRPTCSCGCDDVAPCVVLDPFAGSGTTLRVALAFGREPVGVDISESYLDELVPERTSNVQMQLAL